MNNEALEKKDFLFVSLGSKLGTVAKRFGDLLAKLIENLK